jgi:hypothetical protein
MAASEWRISWDIEQAIMPIAEMLSACTRRQRIFTTPPFVMLLLRQRQISSEPKLRD